MITDEQKEHFILLRAENKSYAQIEQVLHISKSSCINLSKELNSEISQARAEKLQEIYDNYAMTKETRIKNLGETLKSIDKALNSVDLSKVSPKDLLELKLKYSQALQEEYIPITACKDIETQNSYIEELKALLKNEREFRNNPFSKSYLTKSELNTELLLLDKIKKAEQEDRSNNELRGAIRDPLSNLTAEERLELFNKLMAK